MVRQISSRHEEVLDNLDRVDKLATGKERMFGVNSEEGEPAWDKTVNFQRWSREPSTRRIST